MCARYLCDVVLHEQGWQVLYKPIKLLIAWKQNLAEKETVIFFVTCAPVVCVCMHVRYEITIIVLRVH